MGRTTKPLSERGLVRFHDVMSAGEDHPEYRYMRETMDHINQVNEAIWEVTNALNERRRVHDRSKLESPEREGFMAMTADARLKDLTYGSEEYRAVLCEHKPTIAHHYAHNDHHPEYWGERAWHDMPYTARLEALADWYAAGKRMADGGDIIASIRHNADRFGYDGREIDALIKTVTELGWVDATESAAAATESGDATSGA